MCTSISHKLAYHREESSYYGVLNSQSATIIMLLQQIFSLMLKQETQFDFSCGDNHLSQTSMGVKGNPQYNKNTDLGLQWDLL